MSRSWLWVVIISVVVLWLPSSAMAGVPEWGAAPEWDEAEEAEEAPAAERSAEQRAPREAPVQQETAGSHPPPSVSTPLMVGAQAGGWFLSSIVYGMAMGLVLLPLLYMGDGAFLLAAGLFLVGYPFVSAATVNAVGGVLGGGSYFGPTLLGAVLGYAASVVALMLSEASGVPGPGLVMTLVFGAGGPILGYHLGRRAEWRRQGWDVAVAPVMSPPTAWGTQSLEGAGLQLRLSF